MVSAGFALPLKTLALWTGEMVAELIEGNFGVVVSISALRRMLHGFGPFLPSQRLPVYQANLEAIEFLPIHGEAARAGA